MGTLARPLAVAVVLAIAAGAWSSVDAQTPPRLSLVEGGVSFWRPGAGDWAPAQINTPLAPGDALHVGHQGHLELQIGGRAFVRAWGDTQLGLVTAEPDVLRVKVTTGHVSVDLRSLDAGRTVEVDTPGAAFTIQQDGYYRVDVTAERTSFITRRNGRATMTLPTGQTTTIAGNEAVVLEGAPPRVQSDVAPDVDTWDRWNYARTDALLDAVSARYLPPQMYGIRDLDHHGDWRVVPTYGAVWIPRRRPVGWAPYSTGTWILDPSYGWTWVDAAPWGWAPYHHGRWVFIDRAWAWAPGPLVARPRYAPALVAFLGSPAPAGAPFVRWVALGWGEPLVPWWGRPGFVGRPRWIGWGGPRLVNNVVVERRTVVDAHRIAVYRNQAVRDAVIAVRRDEFARRRVAEGRAGRIDTRALTPVHMPAVTRPIERAAVTPPPRAPLGARPIERARPSSPSPRLAAPTAPARPTPMPQRVTPSTHRRVPGRHESGRRTPSGAHR